MYFCRVENCKNEAYYGIGGFISRFCSKHDSNHYECQESNCSIFISALGFCSRHIRSCEFCKNEIREKYRRYCDKCTGKCKFCQVEIYKGEGNYCSAHKADCRYNESKIYSCPQKVSNKQEYCYGHKKECEFEDCSGRIADIDYLTHCSNHPREKQIEEYKKQRDKEKSRAD